MPEPTHRQFAFGDWVSTVHISSGFPKKNSQGKYTNKLHRIPVEDFDLWNMAFQLKNQMTKIDALSMIDTPTNSEIFMVLRSTTRKHGKRRLKVLNPWTGKEQTIFNEQVKQRLSLEILPSKIERWMLLDVWKTSGLFDEGPLATPKNHGWMDSVATVKVMDSEGVLGQDHLLRFMPSSYFGVGCLMCPHGIQLDPLEGNHTIHNGEEPYDPEELIKKLLSSLGAGDNKDYIVAPQDVQLVYGTPHLKPNLTKGHKTKTTLGVVINAAKGSYQYNSDSLYNVQAPNGLETESISDEVQEQFYVPFSSLNTLFTPKLHVENNTPVFANYFLRGRVPSRASL